MIQPGTLLQNRYRVAEPIGKGGMGEVYVATDERFQNKVAIKRTFFDDEEMSRAFRREARLLNHLRHAALPKVSDHFGEDGGQFLVMEFIEGFDLAELMKQRKVPFPLTEVLRWADELLDALEYLHAQEPPVVHRDIKPPNIKLTTHGKIVLLDFGLAKGAPAQTASAPASSVHGFSHNFAPLEQMEGSGTSPRSDLYSLAATLYFLLTGVRPPDAVARAVAGIKEQPDPLRPAHLVQPQVPAAVGQILQRAMAQNPALRHASARELRGALRLAANDAARREARAPVKVVPQRAASPEVAEPSCPSAPPNWPTVLEPAPSDSLARNLRSASSSVGETSLADSRRRTRANDSDTGSIRGATAGAGARSFSPKVLFACLLLICAAAGAYLLAWPSQTSAPAVSSSAETQNPAPQQAAPTPAAVYSDPSQTAAGRDTSSQPAPAQSASEPTEPSPRPIAEAASASDPAGPNTKESGATVESPNGAAVTSNGKPALVIQNPAPAINPADEARRAQESRQQQQPAYPPPYGDGPPPYPPPPGDRRPPPPDGRRPPPPHFRP